MMQKKKKILFIGAGGQLATKILPELSQTYDIVGIAGKRDGLRRYCVDMYCGNLFTSYSQLFETVFRAHTFDAIVWNAVRYFCTSFQDGTREGIHAEFDMAVALPIECIKSARKEQSFHGSFVLVSSRAGLNFYRADLATYSLVKNAQVKLAELLSQEFQGIMDIKVVAPSAVRAISSNELVHTFVEAIENAAPQTMLYEVGER
jgi:hypothetical protein